MKVLFLIIAILLPVHSRAAEGCVAYGRTYAEGEEDCDGRVCGKGGNWKGVVKSGTCDVTDEQDGGREPASHKKSSRSTTEKIKSSEKNRGAIVHE